MKAQRHSTTSISAAEQVEPKAATLRGMVLSYLRDCGRNGATDQEIQQRLEMDPSTERPRRIELCDTRLVVDSGLTRKTASGRSATVWIAAEFGKPAVVKQMELSWVGR